MRSFLIMFLISAFVCCLLGVATSENAGFIQQLKSARGMHIGDGLSLHLDSVDAAPNASLLDRQRLRFDYHGMGISLGKALHNDGLDVGFHYGEDSEGRRGKDRMGQMMIPAIIGFKATTLVTMAMFGIGMFVLKSLFVAKIAILTAGVLLIMKLFGGKKQESEGMHSMHGMELDYNPSEMHPVYAEYPGDIGQLGYQPTAEGNYIAYSAGADVAGHEVTAAASGTSSQYAVLEPSASNSTVLVPSQGIQRRRESLRRKAQPVSSYITVKRKTVTV